MKFYRKIIGERLYLSPFDAEDVEMYSKWAEWMNNKAVADSYGGNCNLVSLSGAKKMVEKFGGYRFAVVLLESDILIGHIHADNCAAIKCYEKAGFKEVGKCREWVYKNGKYVDKIYMDILEGEFKGEPA